jgi:hypothetical protein
VRDLSETVPELTLDDHQQRRAKARAAAQYELGDPNWADRFIDIYTGHDEPGEDAVEGYCQQEDD